MVKEALPNTNPHTRAESLHRHWKRCAGCAHYRKLVVNNVNWTNELHFGTVSARALARNSAIAGRTLDDAHEAVVDSIERVTRFTPLMQGGKGKVLNEDDDDDDDDAPKRNTLVPVGIIRHQMEQRKDRAARASVELLNAKGE